MKQLLLFPFFYVKEVVVGALLIARDVLSPNQQLAPVLLNVPVGELTPRQRLLMACLISMTPGTISVGERGEGSVMVVHSLYGGKDPGAVIEHLQRHYESFVRRLPI